MAALGGGEGKQGNGPERGAEQDRECVRPFSGDGGQEHAGGTPQRVGNGDRLIVVARSAAARAASPPTTNPPAKRSASVLWVGVTA
jgi:hypothetical protein